MTTKCLYTIIMMIIIIVIFITIISQDFGCCYFMFRPSTEQSFHLSRKQPS